MKQQNMFGEARWIGHRAADKTKGYILRAHVTVPKGIKKATLRVLGMGVFYAYINGARVGDDLFLPLCSDYEARENHPMGETVTGHRVYVPQYEVGSLLHEGDNVLALHFGGGWYTYDRDYGDFERRYGDPKAIYRLIMETDDKVLEAVSSEADRVAESYVCDYRMTLGEVQDFTHATDAALYETFDGEGDMPEAALATPIDTDYLFTDCPADGVDEMLTVTELCAADGVRCYDIGKNTSGMPILRIKAPKGEAVRVTFSEEKNDDGTPDEAFCHGQSFTVISDGTERTVQPAFTWFGFRYMAVEGKAEVLGVGTVCSRCEVTARFESDSALLNWLHDAFINTQKTNMHTGIPSDCPHLERRGYTGDGQLICHSAMSIFDAYAFYRKWIADIGDCQDKRSGHVQYTAPYSHSGGGPGGWGCAIVEVPYQLYRHWGDSEPLHRLYPQMLRYFDYLESHSECDLVVRDKEGEWCLGDWCPPERVALPAPFVNNYFYIKSLKRMKHIARLTGHEADIPLFDARIKARSAAIMRSYYNAWDGNFLGGVQGANAFMVDIGLGDERTYPELVRRYTRLGCFDTGIFGTEVLTRVLFEHGDGELACRLLLSEEEHSFAEMRRRGATTLWEYWPGSLRDRSHNHPMFGAVVGCLYDYLVGIRQTEDSAGYEHLVIAPVVAPQLHRVSGSRHLPQGEVSVSYEIKDGVMELSVTLPQGVEATLRIAGEECTLRGGLTRLTLNLTSKEREK